MVIYSIIEEIRHEVVDQVHCLFFVLRFDEVMMVELESTLDRILPTDLNDCGIEIQYVANDWNFIGNIINVFQEGHQPFLIVGIHGADFKERLPLLSQELRIDVHQV